MITSNALINLRVRGIQKDKLVDQISINGQFVESFPAAKKLIKKNQGQEVEVFYSDGSRSVALS